MNYRLLVTGVFWAEYSYISKLVKNWPTLNSAMHLHEKFFSLIQYNFFMGINEIRVKILPLLCWLGLVLQLGSVLVWFVSRDRTNRPLLFQDRIINCTNLFWPKPNHTRRSALATVDHSRHRPEMCGSWNVASASVRGFWPHIRIPTPHTGSQCSCVSNPSEPGKLGHWRTINGCGCGAWSRGDSDPTRPSELYYSICSLCSVGQLAECGAWVNDLRQSVSTNFPGRAVHVSPRILRILADPRPQADTYAVCIISATDRRRGAASRTPARR